MAGEPSTESTTPAPAGEAAAFEPGAGERTADEKLSRPLPSIDLPLLREQRRSARLRHATLAAAAATFLLVAVVLTFAFGASESGGGRAQASDGDPPKPTEAPEIKAAALAASQPPPVDSTGGGDDEDNGAGTELDEPTLTAPTTLGAVTREERPFGNATAFRSALMNAGVDAEEYAELEEALSDVMDFRRCRPEDRMIFERDQDGHLVLFEYHGGSEVEYYRATRTRRGDLEATKVERPVDVERTAAVGTVRASLGAAIVEAGLGRSLVSVVIGAFERKIDFNTDTREGDTFRILVDEERINGSFYRYGTMHAIEYRGQRTGTQRVFWFAERRGDQGEFWDEEGSAVQGGWLRTPCHYDRISSPFDPNRMHPILRRRRPHNGIDYAAGTGTPVWAAADGNVTFAGVRGANGNLVSLSHAGGFSSHYAHLSRIAPGLSRGDQVEQRQLIGYVGSTGRSTGPHLHFGLKQNGRFVDPAEHLNGPGRRMSAGALRRFRPHVRRLLAELEAATTSDAEGSD